VSGPDYYPVSLDVGGRPVLVVGGGAVAARKARGLLECGAAVTVVAPGIGPAMDALAALLNIERRAYRSGEAAGYRLVLTATGRPEVDAAVARDAEAVGVWVNSADDRDNCTFILPSVHRDGAVTVAISTGGASPALASWLRRRVTDDLGEGLGPLAELLGLARQRVQAAGVSTETIDWPVLLDGPFPELVTAGRMAEARVLLEAAIGLPLEGAP
jgi:siroheme synthase-like protein